MELEKLISKKGNYGGTCSVGELHFNCTKDQLQKLIGGSKEHTDAELRSGWGDVQNLCSSLKTSLKCGLNPSDREDMENREKAFGCNRLESSKSKMFLWFVWEALQDQTLIILLIAAFVSIGLAIYEETHKSESQLEDSESGIVEGVGIMVAVVMVVAATAGINYNRDKQFRNLQNRLNEQLKCHVVRNGNVVEIPTQDILVGDVCLIRTGDLIPADGLILQSTDMKVDESSHTGESDDVNKDHGCTLYSGTHAIEGTCKMLVLAVGENSQQGVIFSLLKVTYDEATEPEEKRSILHAKLCKITKYITVAGTAMALATFVVLVTRFCIEEFVIDGRPWMMGDLQSLVNFAIIGITLLVVAIPEGLPLAVILALAYSIKKMMRDDNLVRHLDSCETMGSATIICSDKTGTLTTNKMAVARCHTTDVGGSYEGEEEEEEEEAKMSYATKEMLARCISINSTASTAVDGFSPTGNKTECALLSFVSKLGYSHRDLQEEDSQVKVYSFNSKRKWMGTVISCREGGKFLLAVKGAPEIVLKKCSRRMATGGRVEPFGTDDKERLMGDVVDGMASSGLRTLCLAYREIVPTGDWQWNDESRVVDELVCLALIGIEDPVRPEVPEAVRNCRRAGIEVCMVTGDHLLTAIYVARKCGLLREDDDKALTLTGEQFNRSIRDSEGNFDQSRFDLVWPRLKVLARASPQDKFVMVSGLMSSNINDRKQVVAVTGDGTNDAPALKKAHVGLCMGISGTDVAKEASDIILIDDNFTSIVKSVVWGRHVHDSIAKFIQFQLTINIVSVCLVVIGAATLTDSPLRGVQMLWVNLLMDTLASLSLATEEPTADLLYRKPYCSKKSIISPIMLTNIVCHAFYQLLILSLILWKGHECLDVEPGFSPSFFGKPNVHYTFLFNSFVMMILFNEINSRKIDGNINMFAGIFDSPLFLVIWLVSFITEIILVQWGGTLFFTTALNLTQWLWCVFIGITELILAQIISLLIHIVRWSKQREIQTAMHS